MDISVIILTAVAIVELLLVAKCLSLIKMLNELLEDREKKISKQRVEITILKEKLRLEENSINPGGR